MITASLYNHTAKLFANGEVSLADLKFMLLDGHTFTASHTAIGSIDGDEVDNGGWSTGGEPLASATVTTTTTNDATLDASDISVTATGGPIGPADGGVIYDFDSGKPLVYVDFDGAQTAGEGTDFNVNWHANGIITWTYT